MLQAPNCSLILYVCFQVPEVCPYEAEIVVTLEVTDVLDGGTIVHGPTNQLMFDVSSTSNVTLSCDSTYNVELVVEDQVSDKITIQEMYSELIFCRSTLLIILK